MRSRELWRRAERFYKWCNFAIVAATRARILRRAFKFGYRGHPEADDPTANLKGARIRKQDRPVVDPFTIQDAEALIAAIHRDWGEAQGNYDEFRFFSGLRPSEEIAFGVNDFDPARRAVTVNKARVAEIDKDSTKTGEARRVELCPRAMNVLRRQLALRARLQHEGRIQHDHLFFKDNGAPIRTLLYPYVRWRQTLQRLRTVRYRKPYCARHSSVSWNLMTGKCPLWVAKQHGHTITTMLKAYAAWAEGATQFDIRAIQRAMTSEARTPECTDSADRVRPESSPAVGGSVAPRGGATTEPRVAAAPSPSFATGLATRHRWGRAKCSKRRELTGRERGIRIQSLSRIKKLLILQKIPSPRIPVSPHSCLQIRLQESFSLRSWTTLAWPFRCRFGPPSQCP